ncbi:StbB family protein [Candidatus Enterovibrio escicola]|uniref:StbB family protein n=1 Tax=Candidatus Enterovibrio escicola TaxID=1927127 RepID=UPI001237F13D|nr:StbB family protein [Candidatus Enterovibrio escacola]
MKICVINFSGNVGKSIVSQHLLKPRIKNSEIISVESINSDGTNDEKIRGKRFTDIANRVLDIENIIVDVGASNVEDFLYQMKQSIGSQEDFDYFLVPTILKNKQIIDTVATIDTLNDTGIEKERIRVIFNMIDEDTRLLYDFKEIFNCKHVATISEDIIIYENELFNRLHEILDFESISALAHDDTDFKALIQSTEDKTKRSEYITKLGLKRLSIGVERMLDKTYSQLMK